MTKQSERKRIEIGMSSMRVTHVSSSDGWS